MKFSSVVGLTGLPRAGKDTVAEYLASEHGYLRFSFAGPLYGEVSDAYGAEISLLASNEWKTKPQRSLALVNCHNREFCELLRSNGFQTFEPLTSRQVLQLWGTEYRRHKKPDYWTEKMDKALRLARRYDAAKIVISDCRVYELADHSTSYTEGEYIQALGGSLYEVVRPGAVDTGHSSDWKFPPHMISGLVANVGSIEDLHQEALTVMGIDG